MPLQATSGAASYDAFGGGVAAVPNYIEDVFSTYLYTGNGSTQTITNGIDLSTKGGMTWFKRRDGAADHQVYDTVRGGSSAIFPNLTIAAQAYAQIDSFNANGLTINNSGAINSSGSTFASWTFRRQPKFFDVVTWTGDGTGARTLSHNLGSVPGCIIVKRYEGDPQSWEVYHQSLGNTQGLHLDLTNAASTWSGYWNNTSPTATQFTVGSNKNSGGSPTSRYVAYVFAHNAGGFGLTGTDNVISCGSFTTDGSGNASVTLGYEPQWVVIKNTSAAENWYQLDTMRGWDMADSDKYLSPNTSSAEGGTLFGNPTATGFYMQAPAASNTYIYIAIRRGPMKVPTSGTSVYTGVTRTGTGATANITSIGFPTDLVMSRDRQSADADFFQFFDRLRGPLLNVKSTSTLAETSAADSLTSFASMNGFSVGADSGQNGINRNTSNYVYECFRRAPSFFDEVCYTGTGSARTVAHNLTVAPELMIVKQRGGTTDWVAYVQPLGNTVILAPNLNIAQLTFPNAWNNTSPTSTEFTVGISGVVNTNGGTYVAYLFATCAGVSKVGSYTGTGALQTINCGFAAGARFVLIKRTDSTGDWYVWDSARGIVSGNDPYLPLNSTAAEVTSTDYVDTYSAGFEISSTAPAAINASGGTFIFLAIA